MNNYLHIKKLLYKACENFVAKRSKTINEIISSNKNALLSETKSSAGDKHETGRAMLQLEMEKASQQLATVQQMKAILNKITFENSSDIIRLGSLIITDKESYYLAISAGKITVENTNYYPVSTSSPIGKQLLGIKAGAILPFNQAKILQFI